MFWLNFKRIARSGLLNFIRNGVVSLSAILVMTITLFVIALVILTSAVLNQSLQSIRDKVDVNVYFYNSALEQEVLDLKTKLEGLAEVQYVEYISSNDVLANYLERHKDDEAALQVIEELDNENPFGPILNIKAKETSQYKSVAEFLDTNYSGEQSIVEEVNYNENKEVIEKLSQIIDAGEKLGAILTILFVIISILITFNTIRLALFISKEEIHIMKLVGADRTYIRGPFMITGSLYGVFASLVTLILFFPFTYWLGPFTDRAFGVNVFRYYSESFFDIFLVIFASGILLGVISSFLAVTKYLKSK